MMLFYSIHYPKPEKEAELINAMHQASTVIKGLPGCLIDNVFQETKAAPIMALTIWESQEAFLTARPAMIEALKDVPMDEWEALPRQLVSLPSLW